MSRGDRRQAPSIEGLVSVKVDNLSYNTSINDLRKMFEKYGDIGDVHIPRDKYTKQSKGFGFVRFHDKRDADYAAERCDGKYVDGRELRVSVAKYDRPPPSDRKRSRSPRGYGRDRRRSRSPRRSPPRRRSRSPRRRRSRTRSPPGRSASPRRQSRSPYRSPQPSRSPSPVRRRGAGDDDRSPQSSRGASPSPRRESRSPRDESASPRRESRSPSRSP